MPEQAEFYSVRLEVLPFPLKPALLGFSREITLTISPKASNTGYFFTDEFAAYHSLAQGTVFPEQVKLSEAAAQDSAAIAATADTPPAPPELLHLYKFGGSMQDSVFELQTESELTPVSDKPPKWVPVGQSFGLST
jgi:hypothetical protein